MDISAVPHNLSFSANTETVGICNLCFRHYSEQGYGMVKWEIEFRLAQV